MKIYYTSIKPADECPQTQLEHPHRCPSGWLSGIAALSVPRVLRGYANGHYEANNDACPP